MGRATNTASITLTWLYARSAPPPEGTFPAPATRSRNAVLARIPKVARPTSHQRSRSRGFGVKAAVPGSFPRNRSRGRFCHASRAPSVVTSNKSRVYQIVPELLRPGRMAELAERLRLDLPDPLPGDAELPPDLLERPRLPVPQAEPELDDPPLPGRQRPEDRDDLVLHHAEGRCFEGGDGPDVLDELSEPVLFLADGGLQGQGLSGHRKDFFDLLRRQADALADLFRDGLPAEGLHEVPLRAADLVDVLGHVHRDPDDPGLVGDGPADGLADPPGGVSRELVPAGVVELLHRPEQAQVPLLGQVEEGHAAGDVMLGDGDHQTQVGLDQPPLGHARVALHPAEQVDHLRPFPRLVAPADRLSPDALEVEPLLRVELVVADTDHRVHHPAEPLAVHPPREGDGCQQIARELPRLEAHGQVDLLRGGQEGDSADLLEVHPDGVVGGTLEKLLPAAPARTVGLDPALLVLPRDVDDLDASAPEDLLHVCQELLDLLGG